MVLLWFFVHDSKINILFLAYVCAVSRPTNCRKLRGVLTHWRNNFNLQHLLLLPFWSFICQSCIFQPCDLVLHFPVLHFPALLFWSSIFQSRIFQPCIFDGPPFSGPAFSVAPHEPCISRNYSHWPTFLPLIVSVYLYSSYCGGLQKTHIFCTRGVSVV